MATEVVLPQWGMGMQDGMVVKWLKKEGDSVTQGEPLAEIEAAKINGELEAPASGVVARLQVSEGTTVDVGTLLAIIVAPGEEVTLPERTTPAPTAPAAPPVAPGGAPPSAPAPQQWGGPQAQVVPAARRLAQQQGIDLSQVQGSGPEGRILEVDVQRAIETQARPAARTVPLAGMRKTIADRMLQSVRTMAQLTLTSEVDMTEAERLREEVATQKQTNRLRPLHLIVKAMARALQEHPQLNATLEDGQIFLLEEINIGMAIAMPEGLIVPVIHAADEKSILEISRSVVELGRKARGGKLAPEEISGGSFTVSSLAAYDIDAFTPIVNPPQVGILGIGRIVEKPVVYEGEITKRSMMVLSITFDHRALDGAPAAEFLRTVRKHLETPDWMRP